MSADLILLVDDEEQIRKLLEASLVRRGYEVVSATDGIEALRQIRARMPDLIVTDVNMPNMNGFELLKNIRGDDSLKTIPVLMVTAEAKKEDIVLAAQGGASGYIVKPFTKATLEEKVQKILTKVS